MSIILPSSAIRALAFLLAGLKSIHDATGVGYGIVGGRERGLHRIDLGRMDDLLAGEAQPGAELGLAAQGLQILEVDSDHINGLQPESGRRGEHRLTRIQQFDRPRACGWHPTEAAKSSPPKIRASSLG